MRILLTNDDGIFCESLHCLYQQLTKLGDVEVAAPLTGKSGASHSLTLSPIVCEEASVDGLFTGWAIEGTPADCVKLAVLELFDEQFDLIVSGMNIGSNAGVDMLYSGTLAAAVEGAFYGIPSIAVSARIGQESIEEAAEEGFRAIEMVAGDMKPGDVYNINVPCLRKFNEKKIAFVPQAEQVYKEKYFKGISEEGKKTYQIMSEEDALAQEETDREAIMNGFTTITPVKYFMTDRKRLEQLKENYSAGQCYC
ncbi:5'-nucleotidase SurE [Sedimentisphaera cyanobacteriorum]|uniref:5'-nucleotidase SurE n=1 Tax=Sedimentisphaera cyanobacteriorum TaxID=1940790 RepID=A0A1Q2HM42_9BACT|nr:5'/3'-nucleotidase SurE [Sedimentisphaera cyanobacteriorum]AQQ08528.1 5'-nucleotidase SurE [Sedimentisphaera cyanobacteriorum]